MKEIRLGHYATRIAQEVAIKTGLPIAKPTDAILIVTNRCNARCVHCHSYSMPRIREMTTDEKKLFLQFVWARSRMPLKESDFDAPFKIQKGTQNSSALPSASTCFFSLSLPEYESKEILREKLLFAINNVTTMESDYVTNDVEIGEGWRDL